ncbi:coiled-coil domain-containing protein 122 isoform X2 [Gallus gallus]|uniref:coiled-coil domain-containing protein 122 isoform X2 n=1 Tax=Gallus gallus TaxID=9031 RepID=UPI001F02EDF6|nr:coiled-coil domain-containing protein 122 isoform X2 [Gallus gallus]XP_046765791.1 coiled-coil domain-containing protein 122 isoform X2 [Gallus gallus]
MAKENYPSLTEVVKQVAEQQHLQSAEIEKNKIILFQLQVRYQELEKEMDSIMLEMKTAEREIYLQDDAIQVTKYHCESLEAEVGALYSENMKLRFDTETIQEEYEMTSARNSKYREKIKAHKSLFWEMESKMPIVTELAKKKAIVTELRAKKEELMSDLQNPEGSAIKQVQVQNKRYNAILKRLHCQLNKLHSNKRQWHWNIQQMEKKAEELRKCLGEVELQINI